MTAIHLVACAAQKVQGFVPHARDLYASQLFRKVRAQVESTGDPWFILSAQHGLVRPDLPLHPYDLSLRDLGSVERVSWAIRVYASLVRNAGLSDRVVFWAGDLYRRPLLQMLEASGCTCEVPLQGLGIGRQLHRLNELAMQRAEATV